MKTRTLMLLSFACLVAIMLAGAVFLFQLATQDELAEPIELGVPTQVGDMTVAVVGSGESSAGDITVDIEIGGTVDEEPAGNFRMIASGRPALLASTTCEATTAEVQVCSVSFDVTDADGTSRVLFYERGDDQARWVLSAP